MNIEELTKKEHELISKVHLLNGTIEEKNKQINNADLFLEYNIIHQEYANLCAENCEALKRGLFIFWFSISEPSFLTGIYELEENAVEKIIQEIDRNIKNQTLDSELNWMLNYYKTWNYIFSKFSKYTFFYDKMMNEDKVDLPIFDKHKMKNRGQMGIYWDSLCI